MKKLIILWGAVLASLLFCGCPPGSAPYEDFYSRSFVLLYCQVSDISIERRYYPEDDPDYNLGYFISFVADKLYQANRNGEEKQVYDALCEKYNDVTYNRKVRYSYGEYNRPRCSCFFTDLEIWSTADWDAGHPAGTPLDDIVRFESDTPWPYIRSGYTQRYSDKKRGEYYPVHCLVSELTADDMTLLPDYFFILFTSRPALDLQHTIRVRLTDDAGNVYEAGIDVDFSL